MNLENNLPSASTHVNSENEIEVAYHALKQGEFYHNEAE